MGQGPTLHNLKSRARAFLFLPLLTLAVAVRADPPGYSFGVVPQFDQRQLLAIWQPILEQLTRRTGLRFALVSAPRLDEFERRFLAGRYDFACVNPYHAGRAARRRGYQALVRDQMQDLYGVLVVRRESALRSPRDLDGQTVAFPSPNAPGASLLVRADLARRFRVRIVPRYVHTHTSVYLQVAQGLVAAGGGVRHTLDAQPQAVRGRLRVIHATARVPPQPVMAHPRVPLAVQARVRRALLDLGTTPEGQALLAAVPIRRIGPASAGDYVAMEQLGLEEFYVGDPRDGGGTTPGMEEVDRVGSKRSGPRREQAVDDSRDGGGRPRREQAVEGATP